MNYKEALQKYIAEHEIKRLHASSYLPNGLPDLENSGYSWTLNEEVAEEIYKSLKRVEAGWFMRSHLSIDDRFTRWAIIQRKIFNLYFRLEMYARVLWRKISKNG